MTMLCFLKDNQKKLLIPANLLSKNLFNSIMLFFLQNLMLTCMLYSMMYGEEEENFGFARSYAVFVVKFPSAICLHFVLYPEVMQGMNIMKYANNQVDNFVEGGDQISFIIGFM
jgi:hypothetical protein